MCKGFTLLELVVCVAIIGVVTAVLVAWFTDFKETPITDKNGDGMIYYNDFQINPPPDYREILKQHGIDVGEISDEELQKLIKELQNGTSN